LAVAQLVTLADRLGRQVHRRLGRMLALMRFARGSMMGCGRMMIGLRRAVMRRRRMAMRDRRMVVAGGEAVARRPRHRRERWRRFGRSRRRSGLVGRGLLR